MVDHIGDRCRRQPGGETGQPGVTELTDGLDLLGVEAKQGFSIDQSGKFEKPCSRSTRAGSLSWILRSKRPSRSNAGSTASGKLVAPITITPLEELKPSISASIWLIIRLPSASEAPPYRCSCADRPHRSRR